MKYIIIVILGLISFTTHAQEIPKPMPKPERTQLLLNMQVPCSQQGIEYLSDIVNEHGEQEFASGVFAIKPVSKPDLVTVDLLMYVNPKTRTFTIFSYQKVGDYNIACVLAGGTDFTPFSGEYRKND
ncbi:hypothetical protein OAP74_01050 [bacterium]|nr:hypothetical protein [bacterium]